MPSLLVYGKEKIRRAIAKKRQGLQPEPINLDDLLGRLRRNAVTELKLDWTTYHFLRQHGNQNKRSLVALEKALKFNTSVTSVILSWRWHGHHDVLVKLLQLIGQNCTNQLLHLKLVLDDWVPDTVLTTLLLQQQNLITIDLQAVQVLKQDKETGRLCCCSPSTLKCTSRHSTNNHSQTLHQQERAAILSRHWPQQSLIHHQVRVFHLVPKCDHSVVTHCILQQFNRLPYLKALSLYECDLTDANAVDLAEFLQIRGGIAELSVRSNRKLTGKGLRLLCQAPVMKKLDLSLCDLDGDDAKAVAQGIALRPWPVGELALAGNYRVGTMGLLALMHQKCCQKMVSLNMSYCDAKDYRVILVLNALAGLPPGTTLQRIKLQGSLVANDAVATALQRLLTSGSSLRSIQLNDPKDPKPMRSLQLRKVLAGMQQNYELEELLIDSLPTTENLLIWKELNFYLQLNVAGRRALKSQQKPPPRAYLGFPVAPADDWFQVLEKAGANNSLDTLYWIVRQSSATHFQTHA